MPRDGAIIDLIGKYKVPLNICSDTSDILSNSSGNWVCFLAVA